MMLGLALSLSLVLVSGTAPSRIVGILTPQGIRVGPLSSSDLEFGTRSKEGEEGPGDDVGAFQSYGGDSDDDSVVSNSSLAKTIRQYHFSSSLPVLPSTVLVASGLAVVAKGDDAVTLYPCGGVEKDESIWLGTAYSYASKVRVIGIRKKFEDEKEENPRCTVVVDSKWRGHDGDDNYTLEDVQWYKAEGGGRGVEFKDFELNGRGVGGDGVRLDVRRLLEEGGGANLLDVELNGTLSGSWGRGAITLVGIKEDDEDAVSGKKTTNKGAVYTAAYTTDYGDVELLAVDGEARLGVMGREGRMPGGIAVVRDGGIKIRDKLGRDVLSTTEDALVIESNRTVFASASAIVEGKQLKIEGEEKVTVKGGRVEVVAKALELKSHDGDMGEGDVAEIYSRAAIKMGGKGKTEVWSDGWVEIQGGALRVNSEGLESGGLKTNLTMTYLEGKVVVGGEDEVLVKTGGGLEVEGRGGGLAGKVTLEGGSGGITIFNEMDPELILSSPNRTSGILSFRNSDDGKEKGRLEFWQGGEAGIRGGGGKRDGNEEDTSKFMVVLGGEERMRVDENGRVGVGEGGKEGDLKASLHVRDGRGKIKNTLDDVAVLVEGKKGNVIGMIGEGGRKGHVNGMVLGETGGKGRPDFWVISQRGNEGKDRFDPSSLIIGHTDEVTDVKDGGLDKLDFLEVGIAMSKVGSVGIGVDKPRGAKLVVGGEVGAARYLVYSDVKFIKSKIDQKASDSLDAVRNLAVYKCHYDTSLDGAKAWRGMGSGEEYCFVAQEVEKVDKMIVQDGADGEKLIKVNGVLALLVSGVQGVVESAEEVVASLEKVEGEVEGSKEDISKSKQHLKRLENGLEEVTREAEGQNLLLSEVKGGVEAVKEEVVKLKAEAAKDAALRGGLNETVAGFVNMLALANQRIEELNSQVAKLQDEASARGGEKGSLGQGDEADKDFFLEEVNRRQREFLESQDIPVKDAQLKTLRLKWRNEAYEAVKQRRQDLKFYESQ
ncbi:hypothetical protein TrRE_jg7662 [Triparma retinervis]|uniref:Uncharacterized protein n=1 Tax=Triparma retinervis TaxID=2557542 RepID=A0A9W7EFU1_9STRA|nr:hypothetical protein TrRE_jg7662 [Triparma retinervis]